MPLGISEGNPMAIAAMGERYGDRLVNQLAQAGGMIENGLQKVHTMKELQSLSSNLSQISPESPDYQQKLMALGAAHPFAMQDPRGQALISMGNQQHLQWQHQQYAMQAADRAAGRAEAHDNRMYDRAVRLQGMRMKAGEQELDPLTEVTPQPGFSNAVGLSIDQTQEAQGDNATNLPVDLRMPGDDMSDLQIPASLTRRGISMEDGQEAASRIPSITDPEAQVERTAPRDLTDAELLNNKVAGSERAMGVPPTLRSRMGLVKQFGGIVAKEEAAQGRNDFRREMFDKTQAANDNRAISKADMAAIRDQQRHEYRVEEMNAKAELVARSKMPDSIKIPLMQLTKQAGIARRDADIALAERDANPNSAAKQALATRLDMVAKDHELKAISEFAKMKDVGGDNAEKIIVISPDGQKGYIPKSQLESALKRGYKQQ